MALTQSQKQLLRQEVIRRLKENLDEVEIVWDLLPANAKTTIKNKLVQQKQDQLSKVADLEAATQANDIDQL